MTYNFVEKNAEKFICELCDFSCSKSSNYDKHLLTRKHKNTAKILPSTYSKNAENAELLYVMIIGVKNFIIGKSNDEINNLEINHFIELFYKQFLNKCIK